jgi:uncharacterized protein with von Willebrand factor type A (vWA) domain
MQARPLEAIAGFAAHLREHGYRVGVPEQQAMLQAALALRVDQHELVQACWRSLVCGGAGEWRRFPELFADYWFPDRVKGSVRVSGQTRPRRDLRQLVVEMHSAMAGEHPPEGRPMAGAEHPGGDAAEQPVDSDRARGGASRSDPLERRDFRDWLPQDQGLLERIVEDLARRMRARLTRRRHFDPRGNLLDLRKTLRRSLRTGGVPFEPAWLKRRRERPRIFLLVDVSQSMELYAQLFLRIARAFAAVMQARVFVFHTRLAEVTAWLTHPSRRVQEKINAVTAGFGGGTRIAASLGEFVGVHAKGSLSRAARVVIMSDGFDSDGGDQLAERLRAIRAHGARIYWLHPSRELPQSAALAPCAGLITAFAPVHNLESLARLDILLS